MSKDLFQAIADPTRREILKMIAGKSLNIGAIAENFNVSRTAIYKHIKVLTECGLIKVNKRGRERFCEPRFERLQEIMLWAEQYKKFWIMNFDNLEAYLNKYQNKNYKKIKRKSKNDKTGGTYGSSK